MNAKIFISFYLISCLFWFSQGGFADDPWLVLLVAIPSSPFFAITYLIIYEHVLEPFTKWLGKTKPKDGWWKDTGGY